VDSEGVSCGDDIQTSDFRRGIKQSYTKTHIERRRLKQGLMIRDTSKKPQGIKS
jgi:hypothetical protein